MEDGNVEGGSVLKLTTLHYSHLLLTELVEKLKADPQSLGILTKEIFHKISYVCQKSGKDFELYTY